MPFIFIIEMVCFCFQQKVSQQQEKKLEKDLKTDYERAMKNFQKRMKQSYQTEKEKKKKVCIKILLGIFDHDNLII